VECIIQPLQPFVALRVKNYVKYLVKAQRNNEDDQTVRVAILSQPSFVKERMYIYSKFFQYETSDRISRYALDMPNDLLYEDLLEKDIVHYNCNFMDGETTVELYILYEDRDDEVDNVLQGEGIDIHDCLDEDEDSEPEHEDEPHGEERISIPCCACGKQYRSVFSMWRHARQSGCVAIYPKHD
jgi:hypothetical protein